MEEERHTKEFLRLVLNIVQDLPQGKWPSDVVFFLQQHCPPNLDLADPQSLPIIIETIERLLIASQEPPLENIPPNLEEIKAVYEAHLAEEEAKTKETPYWDFYEAIKEFLERKTLYPWEARANALRAMKEMKKKLPHGVYPEALSPKEYQNTLQEVIKKALPPETPLPPKEIEELAKETQPSAAKIAAASPYEGPISPSSKQIEEAAKNLPVPPQATEEVVFREPSTLARQQATVATQAQGPLSPSVPPPKREEATSIESPQKIPPEESHGVAFKPAFTLLHPKTAVSALKRIALTPVVKPLQWVVKITENTLPEWEAKGLKEEGRAKREQVFRKISEIKESLPALKAMAIQGITSADIRKTIGSLLQAGLPPTHPKIVQLGKIEENIAEIEASHPVLAKIFRSYHEFSKKTESWQNKEPQTGISLQTPTPSAWHQKKGYAWSLRNKLNRLGIFLRTHKWTIDSSGRKVIRFVLPDKIVRLVTLGKFPTFASLKRFAYQKLAQPVLSWLGKTTLGKTIKNLSFKLTSYLASKGIKEGAKKLLSWAGLKAILAALPEPVSKIILTLSLIKDIIWGGLKFLIRKFKEKPELAIVTGITMIGLPILLPMLSALKFILTAAGIVSAGIGFLTKAGSFITGIAGKIGNALIGATKFAGNLLSSLTTISLPSTLPTIIGIGGSTLLPTGLTILATATIGASVLKKEGIGEPPPYGGSPISPLPPTSSELLAPLSNAGRLAEIVVWTLNNCGITAVNKNTWEKTEECLKNSNLPNKTTIISFFKNSVMANFPDAPELEGNLQCVGFVRGIMAAFGKTLEARGNAKDYLLDSPPPSGFYVQKTMDGVAAGDLVVLGGRKYGHIAIVVDVKEKNGVKYLHIAEALGSNKGIIRIIEVNSSYFDGYLRAK